MDPLQDVDDLITAHAGEVTLRVTDLLTLFGLFNLNARDDLQRRLTDHGVVIEPPPAHVERSSTVRLRHADTAAAVREPEITRWVLGTDGSVRSLQPGATPDGVLWIDVEAEGIDAAGLDPLVAEALRTAGVTLPPEDAERLVAQLHSHDHRPATHRTSATSVAASAWRPSASSCCSPR